MMVNTFLCQSQYITIKSDTALLGKYYICTCRSSKGKILHPQPECSEFSHSYVCANLPVHKIQLSPTGNTQQSANVKNYQDPTCDTHRSLLPNIILMIKTYWNILCTASQFSICNCDQYWTQNYQFLASSYGSRFFIDTISKYTDI
jgi:hypothetical protein